VKYDRQHGRESRRPEVLGLLVWLLLASVSLVTAALGGDSLPRTAVIILLFVGPSAVAGALGTVAYAWASGLSRQRDDRRRAVAFAVAVGVAGVALQAVVSLLLIREPGHYGWDQLGLAGAFFFVVLLLNVGFLAVVGYGAPSILPHRGESGAGTYGT